MVSHVKDNNPLARKRPVSCILKRVTFVKAAKKASKYNNLVSFLYGRHHYMTGISPIRGKYKTFKVISSIVFKTVF